MDLFKHHLRDKVKQVDLLKHCSRGKIKQVDRFILSRHFQTSFMLKDQASGPFFPEWIFSISFAGKSQANGHVDTLFAGKGQARGPFFLSGPQPSSSLPSKILINVYNGYRWHLFRLQIWKRNRWAYRAAAPGPHHFARILDRSLEADRRLQWLENASSQNPNL